MPASIPLSVRITDDDAAFLAEFEAQGARTPSEKIRAILASARRHHQGARDFARCVEISEDILRPSAHRVRMAQRDAGVRSDFVLRLYERMPELMAELISAAPVNGDETEPGQSRQMLEKFEAALADQIFALIEEILDMGLTSKSRSYNPELIKSRLAPIYEILELLKAARQREKGHSYE